VVARWAIKLILIISVLTTAELWLLGIPVALVLGALAELLEYIPNLGSTLAAVPAVLLALTQDPKEALHIKRTLGDEGGEL
jgi:predicted PurR-regulated permease PerM